MQKQFPSLFICLGVVVALLVTVALWQTLPPRASAGSCAEDAANLLKNGTMAGGKPNTYGVVAKRWKAFVVGATMPNFENALNEGYDPNGSQYIWRDLGKWDAGIYQKVTTLIPGQTYHFWLVWGQALHDVNGSNERATLINRQIGVDLSGGTDPTSPNVIWTVPYYGGSGFNRAEWNLNVVASGTTATFFLRAQNGHTDGRNKVFFDTACLYPVNNVATSTPWSPTPTATLTLTPAPTQTPLPGTKIDDTAANITYNGAWTQGADARAWQGTYHWARGAKGAAVSATYPFTGTQVTIWYIGYRNRGKAKVVIDGVKVGVIDQYTPGVTFNLAQSFFNLAPGAHQLKVKNAGAKNPNATDTIITLDAIQVPNPVASNAFQLVAQRLTRTPTPTRTPMPTDTRVPPRLIPFELAAPAAPTPDDPSVIWDPRLPGLNVSLQTANVSPGTLYWKLIRADYNDPFQHGGDFGGDHDMYYVTTDESGARIANQKVWQAWPDDKTYAFTKSDGIGDIPMWANYYPDQGPGPYSGYVDGLPSDVVSGMGLPANNHVSFILYFQKTVKTAEGSPTATPTFTPTDTPTLPPTATPTATQKAPPPPTATPTAPPTGTLVDDTAESISYNAGWILGNDARAINGTFHYGRGIKGTPVKLTYNFNGTQIKIWYIGYRNRGKAVVRIDGVKVGVIDQYTNRVVFGLSQTYDGLAPEAHTLRILNKGAKNPGSSDTIIVLDALEVFP
jgi:hypothetical protein